MNYCSTGSSLRAAPSTSPIPQLLQSPPPPPPLTSALPISHNSSRLGTAQSSMHINDLPPELLSLILRLVYNPEHDLGRRLRLCLVCQWWRTQAFPLLYEGVCVIGRRVASFEEAIRRRPELGAHCKVARLRSAFKETVDERELLKYLPNVEELYLSATTKIAFEPILACSKLVKLVLYGVILTDHFGAESNPSLPFLVELSLCGVKCIDSLAPLLNSTALPSICRVAMIYSQFDPDECLSSLPVETLVVTTAQRRSLLNAATADTTLYMNRFDALIEGFTEFPPHLKHLAVTDFHGNQVTPLRRHLIEAPEQYQHLETLHLPESCLRFRDVDEFEHWCEERKITLLFDQETNFAHDSAIPRSFVEYCEARASRGGGKATAFCSTGMITEDSTWNEVAIEVEQRRHGDYTDVAKKASTGEKLQAHRHPSTFNTSATSNLYREAAQSVHTTVSTLVECPLCDQLVPETFINAHIDSQCRAFLSSSAASTTASMTTHSTSVKSEGASDTKAQSGGDNSTAKKRKLGTEALATSSPSLGRSAAVPPMASTSKRARPPQPPPPSTSKGKTTSSYLNSARPLPDLVRPQMLKDLIGQEHLLGEGMLLRGLIERDRVQSCLFWGPPGTGKTTIARVIAKSTSSIFKELSATSANTADLRKAFEEATNVLKLTGRKTVLFIDEIQRFNKGLQDLFLPVVESGLISLIASTTENPSFRVNGALLSRCRVFVLEKLGEDAVYRILLRALRVLEGGGRGETGQEENGKGKGKEMKNEDDDQLHHSPHSSLGSNLSHTHSPATSAPEIDESILSDYPFLDSSLLRFLAAAADGDARVALSSLELALSATKDGTAVDREELKKSLRKAHLQYDRNGDHHYDTISALHKSVRGGDANAALYWLARMLEGGDDPLYVARRLIRMASEDIGLANPSLLGMAVSAYQATLLIGMPECDCILAEVVVALAESPKSIRTYSAYKKAKALVRDSENYPVPLHIRNAPTGLMKKLGYGKDYRYNPGFAHPVWQSFLPPEIADSAAQFLQDDESIEGRTIDEAALREWEEHELTGERWSGRDEMERKLRELGGPDTEETISK
ncbi:ssDNA-dependent ATPase MGS1 [Sporobolomyces salmoneus]|uniref:ssDNA-dependent ATPase MGS1 n=1 Tax=Sporobolomyces salmoneus TaxID=183962 RepID=UPI00316C2F36